MSLLHLQTDFIACLHDPALPPPADWDARMARGLEVYRNNYRHASMEAMRSTYERTRRWVGEDAFAAAAAHHLVAAPPSSWTLDDAGAGFAQVAAALFARDAEVGDLAALEWAMHRAFVAAEGEVLDAAAFRRATAGFAEDDWAEMRVVPQPALALVRVRTDCVALWRALASDERPPDPPLLVQPRVAVVWREGWRTTCCLVSAEEGEALRLVLAGQSYGDVCVALAGRHGPDDAALEAGRMLSWWLQAGMLAGVERALPDRG